MKSYLELFEKNDILKSLSITVLSALLGYIFYLLAYVFFYAYYFHGSKLPIFRILINPIPLEIKSLIFLGVLLAIAIIAYSSLVYEMYKINNSLKLLIYVLLIYIFVVLFIFGLIYFSNKRGYTFMPFIVALIPTAFALLLYMIYNRKILELISSCIFFILIGTVFSVLTGSNGDSTVNGDSFWMIFLLGEMITLILLPRKFIKSLIIWCIFFYLTIQFDPHINPLFSNGWLLLIIYLVIPTILTFIFIWSMKLFKYKDTTLKIHHKKFFVFTKNIIRINRKVILSLSVLIILLFLINFVYMLGEGLSTYVNDDYFTTIHFTDYNKNAKSITGRIIANKGNTYYISTHDFKQVIVTNVIDINEENKLTK
jgi:hypothetical protein